MTFPEIGQQRLASAFVGLSSIPDHRLGAPLCVTEPVVVMGSGDEKITGINPFLQVHQLVLVILRQLIQKLEAGSTFPSGLYLFVFHGKGL